MRLVHRWPVAAVELGVTLVAILFLATKIFRSVKAAWLLHVIRL